MARLIDLTYPLHDGMFKYPSDAEAKVKINPTCSRKEERVLLDESGAGIGAGFTEEILVKSGFLELVLRNHHGTHIDAPAHKLADGKKISDYKIEKFINSARLIDLTRNGLMKRQKREITRHDIEPCLRNIGSCSALIFYTGFCDEMSALEGTLSETAKTDFESAFPYFSEDAARYIAQHVANMNIIGIDSFAVDRQGSKGEVHKAIFRTGALILETLVNLKQLRNSAGENQFILHSVPLSYLGGDAAQTRAYAET